MEKGWVINQEADTFLSLERERMCRQHLQLAVLRLTVMWIVVAVNKRQQRVFAVLYQLPGAQKEAAVQAVERDDQYHFAKQFKLSHHYIRMITPNKNERTPGMETRSLAK